MPDLGTYAVPVLSAYAISLGLIAGIIVLSFWQARRARRMLHDAEARANAD